MFRFPAGLRHAARAAVALIFATALSAGAEAAQRTFVASSGSDANNCTLSAPCRSFGIALTHTDADGEIIVLDSAGYGRVTIDRSVSITAPAGVYAGISVFAGTHGVTVTGALIVVALRGLTINGQGGDDGIVFTQGSRLYIEQCVISNMTSRGITLVTGETFITDSTIRNNTSYGVWAQGSLDLAIDRTRIERNGNSGLRIANGPTTTVTNSVIAGNLGSGGVDVEGNNVSSETVVTVTNSNASHNFAHGIVARSATAGSIVRLAVVRSTVSRNGSNGVSMVAATTGTLTAVITDNTIVRNLGNGGIGASGAGLSATIANNAVSGNGGYGVQQSSSALLKTRLNNVVQDNPTNISGTLTFVSGD